MSSLYRGGSRFLALFAFSALLAASRAQAAEPGDAAALAQAERAMNTDYLGGKSRQAIQRLQKAQKSCDQKSCSAVVRARLLRDLGVVYIAGLGKVKEGREALARAVQADPGLRLEPDLTTPEVSQAFREVGGGQVASADEVPKTRRPEPELVQLDEPAPAAKSNWISLSLQQDFFVHQKTENVCRSGRYQCFSAGGTPYTGQILASPRGNQSSGGFGSATTRLLAGFDRLVLPNLLLGARLGIAFRGAPTSPNGDKFLPLHLEARVSYFFGSAPFENDGLKPFVQLGFGIAEVDARVAVDYYESEAGYAAQDKGVLDAWRKAGKSFFAPGVGAEYVVANAHAVFIEARLLVMLGASGIAPALAAGYSYGL